MPHYSLRTIVISKSVRSLLALMTMLLPITLHAQLPELALPKTGSGVSTTARFFGGATADNGVSYKSSFGFSQPITVSTEIRVEAAHVNTMGNLYIIIALGQQYFMRDQAGKFLPWDLTLPKLVAASPAKNLQISEPLPIVNNVAFGPAGVSGASLSIFLAYNTMAAPNELYYSGTPLTFAIDKEVVTPASLTLFTNTVSSQIIQSTCIICHSATANAGAPTNLHYVSSSQANSLSTNYTTLVNYIKTAPGGSALILSKPRGVDHSGGALLSASSQNFLNLTAFVNAVKAE